MATTAQSDSPAEDLTLLRRQLRDSGLQCQPLEQLSVLRPVIDIAIDWIVVLAAVLSVAAIGALCAPLALLVIGNRQRALGNVLHDGGHGNLHRCRAINDAIVATTVAPLLFASLAHYRKSHFAHHRELGDERLDPDLMKSPGEVSGSWLRPYIKALLAPRSWWGSLTGHLFCPAVCRWERTRIALWWMAWMAMLYLLAGGGFALLFLAMWVGARATVFHGITTFREMCDHFGLPRGGVVSFTRDFVARGVWVHLVHPRNNGYHLTHHLLPAVPYYRLPQAQRLIADLPLYRKHGRTYTAYLFGARSVAASWQAGVRA